MRSLHAHNGQRSLIQSAELAVLALQLFAAGGLICFLKSNGFSAGGGVIFVEACVYCGDDGSAQAGGFLLGGDGHGDAGHVCLQLTPDGRLGTAAGGDDAVKGGAGQK